VDVKGSVHIINNTSLTFIAIGGREYHGEVVAMAMVGDTLHHS
jgi:hypothetical protein